MRVLTTGKQSSRKRGKDLEGSLGEVNRRTVVTGWAGVRNDDVDGLALPGNPNRLAAV